MSVYWVFWHGLIENISGLMWRMLFSISHHRLTIAYLPMVPVSRLTDRDILVCFYLVLLPASMVTEPAKTR